MEEIASSNQEFGMAGQELRFTCKLVAVLPDVRMTNRQFPEYIRRTEYCKVTMFIYFGSKDSVPTKSVLDFTEAFGESASSDKSVLSNF